MSKANSAMPSQSEHTSPPIDWARLFKKENLEASGLSPKQVKILRRWRRMNVTLDEVLRLIDGMKRATAEQRSSKTTT